MAAVGRVMSQAARMVVIVFHLAWRVTVPMPKRAPQDTWVVDTGRPKREAPITRAPVMRLAVKPWPWLRLVTRRDIVSATRRALMRPPAAMRTATAAIAKAGESVPPTSMSAAIFGVSLRPRAKDTRPAERKCERSRAVSAEMPTTVPV